jgi:hypothetical protein
MKELLDMNWCLGIAPSDAFFITSDAPACPFILHEDGTATIGAGFGQRGVEVTLPLSPTVCLLIDRTHQCGRMRFSAPRVHDINRRTAQVAERFIISPHDTKRVRELVRRASGTWGAPKLDHDALRDDIALLRRFQKAG